MRESLRIQSAFCAKIRPEPPSKLRDSSSSPRTTHHPSQPSHSTHSVSPFHSKGGALIPQVVPHPHTFAVAWEGRDK